MAEAGTQIIEARRRATVALQAEIELHQGPFPKANLILAGDIEEPDLNAYIINGFRQSRSRDGAAGRSLFGPHRMDFSVIHRDKNRPAAEGSTGEQKHFCSTSSWPRARVWRKRLPPPNPSFCWTRLLPISILCAGTLCLTRPMLWAYKRSLQGPIWACSTAFVTARWVCASKAANLLNLLSKWTRE